MKLIRVAALFARREARSAEFRLLAFALLLAVATTTAISLFSDRLSKALLVQSAELIGGDLVLQSSRPLAKRWSDYAQESGLQVAELAEFGTVLVSDDNILLASVKAAGSGYPLRGQLRVADSRYGKDYPVSERPDSGEVWADVRAIDRLGIKLGDSVAIGIKSFRVTRMLTLEPDRGSNFFNLSPRILMNHDDLNDTQVVQPGSRVRYSYLYTGQDTDSFAQWLKPQMGPGQKLLDIRSSQGGASKALNNADRYLRLIALMAVLLASVAIAVTARSYSDRQLDVCSMLRCLGATQRTILYLYLLQFMLLALLAGLLGCLLGWAVHLALLFMLDELLPSYLPAAGIKPLWTGLATGFVILWGTLLPPILRLKSVPPLRVIRRHLLPHSVSAWLLYAITLSALLLLVILLSREVWLTLMIFAAVSALVLLLALIVYGLLKVKIGHRTFRYSIVGRGIGSLARRARENSGQIIAFAVTMMLMLVIAQLRTELLSNWQNQLPKDAPNNFAFNILSHESERFSDFLDQQSIKREPLYPMVRGRLTAINDRLLKPGGIDPVGNDESINRELNLTWSEQLPADNRIVSGEWWDAQGQELEWVSVEAELAGRLRIEPGDRLTFNIAGVQRQVRVKSLRTVRWENFSPNFYMVFPPGALRDLPVTYITSFRLDPQQRKLLLELVERFPSVTVLEVDVVINQIRTILRQVTAVVEFMLVFVLLAGFLVLIAAVQSSLRERLREAALMRALGARRRFVALNNLMEFGMLGLLSGVLAVLGAEIINAYLYDRLFRIDRVLVFWDWLLVPVTAAVLIAGVGYWTTRKAVTHSPKTILQHYQ